MIPKNISRQDALRAIDEIKSNGIPPSRHSAKWSVSLDDILYPPKYIVSLANKYASGQEWPAIKFSGGEETNEFLGKLGFEIVRGSSRDSEYPIASHSWQALSDLIAVKEMDKSSFLHRGTAIPFQLRAFFGIEDFIPNEKREITLCHKDIEYSAHFQMDKEERRVRLFWKPDFAGELKQALPGWFEAFSTGKQPVAERPIMRFKKLRADCTRFSIELINPSEIGLDIESEIIEEQEPKSEGAVKHYYTKHYERDAKNRSRAIQLHGSICLICGFDFELQYGERGRGYIEIHHTKPLSLTEKEQIVDPNTDLIPVCSNCHRMIHRRKDAVLSIAEMRKITKSTFPHSA